MSEGTADAAPGEVVHNEARSRFELDIGGQLAHADYRRRGDTLVFHHTFVPHALRGRGHAARVVRAGLEYARDAGLRVDPRCAYVARYIDRHRQFAALRGT